MNSKQTNIDDLYSDAVNLLKQLIAIPSFSKEEDITADCLEEFFRKEKYKNQSLFKQCVGYQPAF